MPSRRPQVKETKGCRWYREDGGSRSLGGVQGIQREPLWNQTDGTFQRPGSRKKRSATGHNILCHFTYLLRFFYVNHFQSPHRICYNTDSIVMPGFLVTRHIGSQLPDEGLNLPSSATLTARRSLNPWATTEVPPCHFKCLKCLLLKHF